MSPTFKRLARYGFYALVLISLGVAAREYLSGEALLAALGAFNWLYAPLILGLTVIYVLLKGVRFVVFLHPLVDYGRWALLRAYLAGQVATLMPAGGAARAVVLEQVGVSLPKGGAAVLFASLSDQAVLLSGLLVAAIWFEAARLPALIALGVLAALGVLLWFQPVRTRLLGAASWLMRKLHLEEKWELFQGAFDEGLSLGVALRGLAFTAAAFALMPVALELALRGLGLTAPPGTLLLAFVLPTILGRLSSLPGGVGVTEASMVTLLSAVQGIDANLAAAAVAVFRVGTVFFAAVFGGVVYLAVRLSGGVEAAPS
jgi:uncharacterized protein (TIRG00374 family)